MKRLSFRSTFVSTGENAGTRTKRSQTTDPQLFYIVCVLWLFVFVCLFNYHFESSWIVIDCKITGT